MRVAAATPLLRPWAMRLHRWVALAVGAWFALLGLSGSVLVWHGEIDRALNPQWFAANAVGQCADASASRKASEAPLPTGEGLGRGATAATQPQDSRDTAVATPIAAALAIHARHHDGKPTQVMAPATPGAAYVVWTKTGDGARMQHFVDVGCRRYLGHRQWGAVRFDREHVVPALYELHRSILSGEIGHIIVGFVGLLLLATAITGLVTAWPRHATRDAWKRTLTIKRGAATRRWFYDLHRATGMWLALFLLLMSVTGAYLCFPKQGRALVAAVLPMADPSKTTAPRMQRVGDARGGNSTKLAKSTAPRMRRGENAEESAKRQAASAMPATTDELVAHAEELWVDAEWSRVQLPAKPGEGVEVRLLQAAEIRMDTGDTRVKFDATGRISEVRDPVRAPAGDRLISWLFPLHSGEALGLTGRLAWTLFGSVPPLMFATGLWLWWQRRKARTHAHEHRH
jgi:uncharacterized iron-regulated membrane protein